MLCRFGIAISGDVADWARNFGPFREILDVLLKHNIAYTVGYTRQLGIDEMYVHPKNLKYAYEVFERSDTLEITNFDSKDKLNKDSKD